MISSQGITANIESSLIGRLSFSAVPSNQKAKTIIVNPILRKSEWKSYQSVLLSNRGDFDKSRDMGVSAIYLDADISALSEGDIVEIQPDGRLSVLYQITSRHNVIFATSKCNSNCIMCPQPVDNSEGSLTDRNLEIISLMDKCTDEIAITGGEPTIIGKDLFRLILACKKLLPSTSLLLLSNARKFSDFEYTHFFSSLQHPNLILGTSLYGDNDTEHDRIVGSDGAFHETVKGILNLGTFRNRVEIRTVIHKYTYQRLTRIAEFIYRNMTFVSHIAFMGLEIMGAAKQNLESLWVEPTDIRTDLENAVHYLNQRDMNVSIYNIPLCLLPHTLWKYARQSISDWKNSFALSCHSCSVKGNCSGLFNSGLELYSAYLKPI
ncbi:MAG: His-Xaa-Ser system radical SAM maturase HxsC [Nitrospirae bacterium]|nr:MAG: His-Xaa-Ser system radical SAM maturase HxsC [Nitrospirota bacterium]